MTPGKMLAALAVLPLLATSTTGFAQRGGEITFYSDIAFRGRTFVVTGARDYARVPFTVRSARIARGEAWQICADVQYRGRCNTVDSDQGNIAWTVNSVRPARGTPGPGPGAPGSERTLRGMSAEFFVQPSAGGRRVASCTSGAAACAKDSANRFCQSRGWTASSYERQETVAGRNYLADVLCTRTR